MSNDYFSSPTDVEAVTKARSTTINALDAAIDAAFDKVPTELHLKRGTTHYAVDTGTANTYLVSKPYTPSGYVDGLVVEFRAINTNTGASTINVNSLGVKSIKRAEGSALSAGDITVGVPVRIQYSTATGFFHLNGSSAADVTAAAASATAAASSASSASSSASAASSSASTASTHASSASASATSAASIAAGVLATSTTSLLIEVASKTFTTQASKQFAAGQFVTAASAADVSNYMHGQVTSYSGTTLIVNVTNVGGSGTLADWNISISGSRGAAGATGATGAAGVFPCVAAGGTVNAITADYTPNLTLTDLTVAAFVSAGANTSTTPTFAPDGLTARTITKNGGQALAAGDIGPAGYVGILEYNSANTRWELLNPVPNNSKVLLWMSI